MKLETKSGAHGKKIPLELRVWNKRHVLKLSPTCTQPGQSDEARWAYTLLFLLVHQRTVSFIPFF